MPQSGGMQMPLKGILLTVIFLTASLLTAKAPGEEKDKTPQQQCRLISADPPEFNLFQFVPKKIDFTKINRFPKLEYDVDEYGIVGNVKILKGTGSRDVDTGLVKSIKKWKYQPQPGCSFKLIMSGNIEIGLSWD
jgi:TonB family protein